MAKLGSLQQRTQVTKGGLDGDNSTLKGVKDAINAPIVPPTPSRPPHFLISVALWS